MAFSGSAGYMHAHTSVRIHAPLECFHSSLLISPDMGGSTPSRMLALHTPYSFQWGVIHEHQYSPRTLLFSASGPS